MPDRLLLMTADDFGIGPETTRGILDLAACGVMTSSVLLVNSPFAMDAVRAWKSANRPLELGWPPCLTLDAPILPPAQVPSLVSPDGRFLPLGQLMKRLTLGRINSSEVAAEFRAQLGRFVELVGHHPTNVNAHHHIHVFCLVSRALTRVLSDVTPRPFIRRVVERFGTLACVRGARLKRAFLTVLGNRAARHQARLGFPGNETFIGVTDPQYVHDPEFFARWLRSARGRFVELGCHPGYCDPALAGRDDDPLHRRPCEHKLLRTPEFLTSVQAAGFRLVSASEMAEEQLRAATHRSGGGWAWPFGRGSRAVLSEKSGG
jgi:chitin disaccharide deacetylase